MVAEKPQVPPAFSVGAGAFAGMCSTCVTNPFDTLRVRLAASREATGCVQKSLWFHFKELFSSGIVRGFSVGLGMNLVSSMPANAIYLPSYHFLNREAKAVGLNAHAVPVVSAMGAVCCTNLTLGPFFLIRTQVQIDPSKTALHYAREVVRKDGFRGFYRGTGVNICGRIVEEATFWYVYETLKRATNEGTFEGRSFGWASMAVLSLSSVSKLIGTGIAYPYNVVMTHFREVDKKTGIHNHTKVIPTVRHIYRCDGLLGFYKGLAPQLMRSVMSKATQIYAFELALSAYVSMNA